ncbi:MAG: hypothetical protein KKB90_06760 [Actinobacteria bacterium]|nr:hypothetical protein [Actinomycetota bacterium]MCG2817409.1 hypothetical protein [Actinomycetes bacterium]MBU4218649.1 hypothetical protein [Actinomycetota bacterium]MBU4358912.1 hypothetical protein [Actinomycetota bacterium]MBU4391250.1 hypothetical protein [Actinomycetota bacterium]
MRKRNWYLLVGVLLVLLSMIVYAMHYAMSEGRPVAGRKHNRGRAPGY